MLYKLSKNMKVCGCCDYWEGLRKIDSIYNPQQFIIEGKGAEEVGICSNRQSSNWNMKKQVVMTCPKFELMARLRSYK